MEFSQGKIPINCVGIYEYTVSNNHNSMLNFPSDWLIELKAKAETDPKTIPLEDRKKFWRVVGKIKRMDKPEKNEVKLLAEIRELFYMDRFGDTRPIKPVLIGCTIAAVGIIISIVMMKEDDTRVLGMILSWVFFTIFSLIYSWILKMNVKWTTITFTFLVLLTIIIDLILLEYALDWFLIFNQIGMVIAVPILYLHGRWIGGLVSGIKFDGVNRDIYYLVSLKVNYESYLLAKPDKRQWIFFFGGIGTVITGYIVSIILLIVYSNPYLFIFPTLLFFGELLDYRGAAGKLAGGEFQHLRREHRIIKDWKDSLA